MLTNAAFTDFRNFIKNRISAAEYKANNVWSDAPISEIEITDDGIVRVKAQISPGAAVTITGVRLISTANEVWATKDVNVVIDNSQTNVLQWFDFNVTESEVS